MIFFFNQKFLDIFLSKNSIANVFRNKNNRSKSEESKFQHTIASREKSLIFLDLTSN